MGSHGGASAEGQSAILAGYGITQQRCGAPVLSAQDVVEVDRGDLSVPVYMDTIAFNCDGIIAVNRIKPHTDYRGRYESGIVKMLVIGLGNHAQARLIHRYGVHGLKELMPKAARRIVATGKILAGVAIVENASDRIMKISCMRGDEIFDTEPPLLELARKNMPSLPVDKIDVCIVDTLGKDISGTGLDPTIIGRMKIFGEPEPSRPNIRQMIIRDLSPKSHGNALGIGFGDIITQRLYEKIDFSAMYENVYTSTFFERAKVPIVAKNDSEALDYAFRACWGIEPEEARIVRIRDTLHINELYVSTPILDEIGTQSHIETIEKDRSLFDKEGTEMGAF
jgi:hypothetical protein